MSNQPSNRRIIGVRIGPRKPQRRVPRVSRGRISGSKRRNLRLSRGSRVLRGLVSTADVGQLVVDPVGDDVGVQGLFLPFIHQGIDGLEGRLRGGAVVEPGFEFHGGDAEAEVERGVGGGDEAGEVARDGVGDCAETGGRGCADHGTSASCAGSCGTA